MLIRERAADTIRVLGLHRRPVVGVLLLLLVIDVAMVGFYISGQVIGRPGGFVFDLGADRSYGEFFQYMKSTWAVIMLGMALLSRRAAIYAAWGVVCLYLLIDDAFMLHEHAGWAIRDQVPGKPGWAVHVGELTYLTAIGLILIAVVAVTHLRARPADRAVSWVLIVLFGILAFFGVAVDAAHQLLFPGPTLNVFFTVVEDGGEMLALTAIVAFIFGVTFCSREFESLDRTLSSVGAAPTT